MAAEAPTDRAPGRVLVSLPAVRESLPLARAVTGAVAADAGATMAVIDDARQVVTEAVALVLGTATTGGAAAGPAAAGRPAAEAGPAAAEVRLVLESTDGGVVIDVRGAGDDVDPFSFGWLLIDELSREATAQASGGELHVRARVAGAPA